MALFAGLLLVAAASVARAQSATSEAAESFLVRDVRVDITADNVNLARDQAFAQGQRQAFQTLIARFTTADQAARLPEITDDQLDNLVLDVGVDQEKRSTVRYIATLSVRFKPDAVRQFLSNAGIAFVEWRGPPVTVLPVLKTDAGPILWEEPNPWREAWKSEAAQGLVPFAVPNPPPSDRAPDDALRAATADPGTLTAFASRFGSQDLLIAAAVAGRTADGRATLDVTLVGAGPLAATADGAKSWQGEADESQDALMRRAVTAIAQTLNDSYKTDNAVPAGEAASSISVMVPLAGLPDWIELRRRLTRVPLVRRWDIGAISKSSASLVLHYVGEQAQLETALVQNGMVLTWVDDHWMLQTALAKPPAAPAQ